MAEDLPRVRLAFADEAANIAQLQMQAWSSTGIGSHALAHVTPDDITHAWALSIARPPLATYRVLVAVTPDGSPRGRVVGFAAIGPSCDEDAEPTDADVAEFIVDRDADDVHSDQLMNAVADTLRADGFTRATWWLATTDDEKRAFLTASGWAPDGAHRTLGDDSGEVVRQVRLHTDLT